VYAGKDPLTGRPVRHRRTVKTEQEAQIALGHLLENAAVGKRPDTRVTVGDLLARYMEIADLDLSTRRSYHGYIRRVIQPALGSLEVRKVRGPMLDTFFARLRRCGNPMCAGRPFTEHVLLPPLDIGPGSRPAWQQVSDQIRDAITSGILPPGEELPSAPDMASTNGLKLDTVKHGLAVLDREGLITVRHGRRAIVADHGGVTMAPRSRRPGPDHDCGR
jgi:hypothetical protein